MITNFNDAKSMDLTLNFREELRIHLNSVYSILQRIINPLLIHLQSIESESLTPNHRVGGKSKPSITKS